MQFPQKQLRSIVFALSLSLSGDFAFAGGRFSQLILSFPNARKYQTTADEAQNSLTIYLEKTSPAELESLDQYDERLIRRLLIKDLGPLGTEIKLILRDRNLRATVTEFSEPFRIAIDLHDKDYTSDVDPSTGLPIVTNELPLVESPQGHGGRLATNGSEARQMGGNLKLLNPEPSATASHPPPADRSSEKRRLLQPLPDEVSTPGELEKLIMTAPEGRGKSWNDFPMYVYPIQTAAYEGRPNASGWVKTEAVKALSSAQALAEYAYKLFSFGHEGRALLAYQQVLHRDASIFAKDALHLWSFAEVNLGQGNLTLAEGYYDTLIEKHPSSAMAKFAALRRLDVKAIRILQARRPAELSELLADLGQVNAGTSGELRSQIGIRKAYWTQQGIEGDGRGKYIPSISEEIQSSLMLSQGNIEGQRTAFITASILLKNLVRMDRPWSESTGPFADQYFKNYKNPAAEPVYGDLKLLLHKRLSTHLIGLYEKNEFSPVIHSYENLPQSLKSITKDSAVAWAVGESYRSQEILSSALGFYEQALKDAPPGTRRFQIQFWIAVLAGNIAEQANSKKQIGQRDALLKRARAADQEMRREWTSLRDDDRAKLSTAYKSHLEKAVQSPLKLRGPADIVLETWSKALSSRMDGSNGGTDTQWTKNFSPSAGSVHLLADLAKKYTELGVVDKKREAIRIMQALKPEEFSADKDARETWNRELLALAEDYRKNSDFLEAGRLYTFTAKNAGDIATRAETLYKGGLMLYRSGQREEAINALTLASEDGNNLFYANLAKERLSQLKK